MFLNITDEAKKTNQIKEDKMPQTMNIDLLKS